MKYISLLLLTLFFAVSCTETTDENNANISSFYLVNKSIKDVSKIKFKIDNTKNTISNLDSANYGIAVDSVFPYIVGTKELKSITINGNISYNVKDTIFIDFSKPVVIKTLAKDGKTSKEYTVNVIVHKVNPDTFIWTGANSQIYTEIPLQEYTTIFRDSLYMFTRGTTSATCYVSKNATEWIPAMINGLPIDADLYRIVSSKNALYYSDGISLYSSNNGIDWSNVTSTDIKHLLFSMHGYVYAQKGEMPGATLVKYSEKTGEWTEVAKLPLEFPQTGMAVCVAEAPNKSERVFILGGRDKDGKLLKSLWSSDDGSYWADLTIGSEPFSPREGVTMAQYADGLILFGGEDKDGLCRDRLIFSADHGLTWSPIDSVATMPDLCVDRKYGAMLTNSIGYIYVVGGKAADDTYIKNAWRGLRYASLPGFKK